MSTVSITDSSNIVIDPQPVIYRSFLELIVGPMFSGKTTYLQNLYNNYKLGNNKVAVINYSGDTRYDNAMLATHDAVTDIPCIFTENIGDVIMDDQIQSANIILINEGQFFSDLYETVLELVENKNKTVHICGLDGDFKRQKFGALLDLIPISDKIVKLAAKCSKCKKPAYFSHRITTETSQIVIGSSNYEPLCRKCYTNTCFTVEEL